MRGVEDQEGSMGARVRSLSWLVASVWLTGCGPVDEVDVTNTHEGVLPATESSKDFGDYVVYFNASEHGPAQARNRPRVRIVRSKSRAMLSVSIHRKGENGQNTAVTGAVSASAMNLTGQLKTMTLREIQGSRSDLLHRRARGHGRRGAHLYRRRDAEQRSEPLHSPLQEAVLRRGVSGRTAFSRPQSFGS